MKIFSALVLARTKEFYRDRGSLSWSFIFPVLIIIGCAVAFSNDQEELFTIGVINPAQNPSEQTLPPLAFLSAPYSKVIHYTDQQLALDRVKHHQLHLLVSSTPPYRYWINPTSSQGKVLEQLIGKEGQKQWQREAIEGRQIRYVDWVIPGVLGMNIMFGALFGVGYVIVRYRKNGVLKRLQATPLNALQFLSAQVFSRLMILLTASIVIYSGAKLTLDLPMLGSYVDLLLVAILGCLSMITLGLLMSSRTESEELAGGMLNATTWPMMFLSGVWFSLDDTPEKMQALAQFLPLTHLVHAAREIMLGGAGLMDISYNLWALTAMTVLFLISASLLFRWHK
jgi:ABC-type multidrug transport system permease subunit